MAQFIEQLRLWVEGLMLTLGYPGLTLVIVLENLFPPIPSTVIMPFAGFLVSQGQFSFVGVLLAGTLGSLISAMMLYYLGRWLDETLVHRAVSRYGRYIGVSEAGFERGMRLFDSYGPAMVFFGRFIGTVRSLISIPAGMRRMSLAIFLPLTV
nr:DedA family protein [Chloroflexaceae bacterium]